MSKCQYDQEIDNYLLDRMTESEKAKFEEHYFNCTACFEKVSERDTIVRVIKSREVLFAPGSAPQGAARSMGWLDRLSEAFSARKLAWAGAAALLLVAVLTLIPLLHRTSPEFVLNGEDTVRGGSITLISPVIDIASTPAFFEWQKIGDDIEYQVSIYKNTLLWKTTTKDNRITLPDEVRKTLTPGVNYSWRVKAFSAEGTLIAVSSRVQFKIKAD